MLILDKIYGMLQFILVSLLLLGIPTCLTVLNLYYFFATKKQHLKLQELNKLQKSKQIQKLASHTTMILGPVFMAALYSIWSPVQWHEPVVIGGVGFELHAPLAEPFMLTFIFFAVIAIIGYFVLYTWKTHLPPLLIVFCVAALYIGSGLSILCITQIAPNINVAYIHLPVEGYFMILFPVNFIILVTGLLCDVIKELVNDPSARLMSAGLFQRTIRKCLSIPVLALVAVFPLLGICIALLALFNQQPDSLIKAFTETSDWLLSTKVSPPPVEYAGHYLCTVAADGHKRLVKPQRMGIRHGHRIIVNRQLCVANAFEQLIAERTPHLHRFTRQLYDRCGYPLSKHIKTPFAADLTYILMKPLEWIFITMLYLFDLHPESRIASQYLPEVNMNSRKSSMQDLIS